MQRLLLIGLLIILAGCGGTPAPLVSKNAKWFDFTVPTNATQLEGKVTLNKLASLSSVKLDLGGNSAISDSDLATLTAVTNLKELDLYLTAVTNKGMEHLTGLPLEILDVSQTQIGDEGLLHIGKIKTLKRLEMFDSKVTDAGLQHLVDLPLFRIDLSKTAVTDAGMEMIAKIQGLERLDVRNMTVSDVGLAHIGKIESLQELSLYEAGEITDEGLKHLHQLKSLKALFLGSSKFSKEGLLALRKALPGCEIAAND